MTACTFLQRIRSAGPDPAKFFGGILALMLAMSCAGAALAEDFDPFDPAVPLAKAEGEYQRLEQELNTLKGKAPAERSADDADAMTRLQHHISALREHLRERGSKLFEAGGKTEAVQTGGDGKTKEAEAGGGQSAETTPSDTGFRFGGLKIGGPLPKNIGRDPGGNGATWMVIGVEMDIVKEGDGYVGKLKDVKLMTYSHALMSQETVDGQSVGAHELGHVQQYKFAWENSHQELRDALSNVSGKSHAEVKEATKDALDKWFPSFNAHYTGRAVKDGVKKEFEQVTGMAPDEVSGPLEFEPEIAEAQFKKDFAGKPKEGAEEIKKRSDALKTGESPPDIVVTDTIARGAIRVNIGLFEGDKRIALPEEKGKGSKKKKTAGKKDSGKKISHKKEAPSTAAAPRRSGVGDLLGTGVSIGVGIATQRRGRGHDHGGQKHQRRHNW